jgi:hypothetical protein
MVAWGVAERRTLQEKKVAELRRKLFERQFVAPSELKTASVTMKVEKSVTDDGYYYPELMLPINLVKSDLTKTLGVAILALISQIALLMYLNRGGWQIILRVFLRGGD